MKIVQPLAPSIYQYTKKDCSNLIDIAKRIYVYGYFVFGSPRLIKITKVEARRLFKIVKCKDDDFITNTEQWDLHNDVLIISGVKKYSKDDS